MSCNYVQIRDFIAAQLQAQGIVFHFGESPTAVEKNNDGTFSLLSDGGKEVSDLVMFATGRAPNTKVLVLRQSLAKFRCFFKISRYVHIRNRREGERRRG